MFHLRELISCGFGSRFQFYGHHLVLSSTMMLLAEAPSIERDRFHANTHVLLNPCSHSSACMQRSSDVKMKRTAAAAANVRCKRARGARPNCVQRDEYSPRRAAGREVKAEMNKECWPCVLACINMRFSVDGCAFL